MTDEPPIASAPGEPPTPLPPPQQRAHPLALGCMGFGILLLALVVFTVVGLAAMEQRIWGFLVPLAATAIVIASFKERRKRGPAPLLGAAVVGLSIATLLFGICYAAIGPTRIQ